MFSTESGPSKLVAFAELASKTLSATRLSAVGFTFIGKRLI
ncbi:hypothetical protein JCM19233_4448 [Vibrio astriarenae]|nr:hypothetical protein JCM19233_4448 [Vibrio sp. C7]